MKRPVSNIYSLSSLTSYEPLVDDTITLFMDRLHQGFGTGRACNMADWLQYCTSPLLGLFPRSSLLTMTTDAFDVILNLTFSNTLGFLEQGKDVENFIRALDMTGQESALVGISLRLGSIILTYPSSLKCPGLCFFGDSIQ